MKSKYRDFNSFYGKMMVVLTMASIIPFLLAIYLFIYEKMNLTDTVILFAALALGSILTGFTLMRKSADKLIHLAEETNLIDLGKKNLPVEIDSDKEVNDIAAHFNSILLRLQKENKEIKEQSIQLMIYAKDLSQSYKKVKEEEKLRNNLSRYVGQNLVEKLINSTDNVFFENERKEVTILFADIRSFTAIAERLEAEKVVSLLNQFFGVMVDIVFKNDGVLDKLIGDQLMAVFGIISSEDSPARNAVKTAIEMQNAMKELIKVRSREKKDTFKIGIGINTGRAIVGNVGSENRMDYTVIGNCVNVAARLQEISKGGEILIGEQTFLQTQDYFNIKEKGEVQLKNKVKPVMCYEVLPQS